VAAIVENPLLFAPEAAVVVVVVVRFVGDAGGGS